MPENAWFAALGPSLSRTLFRRAMIMLLSIDETGNFPQTGTNFLRKIRSVSLCDELVDDCCEHLAVMTLPPADRPIYQSPVRSSWLRAGWRRA
ncbi:MAG: hypothetical protein ACR2PG_16165 [Hyphomicrobiaceae bacterium]